MIDMLTQRYCVTNEADELLLRTLNVISILSVFVS